MSRLQTMRRRCTVLLNAMLVGALPLSAQAPAAGPAYQTYDTTAQVDVKALVQRCQVRDAGDTPKDRVRCWEQVRLVAPSNPMVLDGYDNALRALDESEKAVTDTATTKAKRDSVKLFLQRAQEDLVRGNFDGADMNIAYALEKDPNNRQGRELSGKVSTARVWHSRKQLLMAVGAIVLVLAVGLIAIAKKLSAMKAEKGDAAPTAAAPAAAPASGGRVALRVIDGIGRGRMYAIDSDVFRIGAAESTKVEERNDLIISDADATVSRFHCSLMRRKKRWTIVDSSVNGTWVNQQRLRLGEPAPLRDGDAITIAGVARLTFVAM